jgi:hypothetical protein
MVFERGSVPGSRGGLWPLPSQTPHRGQARGPAELGHREEERLWGCYAC